MATTGKYLESKKRGGGAQKRPSKQIERMSAESKICSETETGRMNNQ